MGGALQVLTTSDIVEINRRMIKQFGGSFYEGDNNLLNPGSLEHVLEEIQGSLFDKEPFPSLFEKAAAICCRIIQNHVFHDGNKRSGMEACRIFLELNGYEMKIDREVVDMALNIATSQVKYEDVVQWIRSRTTKILNS